MLSICWRRRCFDPISFEAGTLVNSLRFFSREKGHLRLVLYTRKEILLVHMGEKTRLNRIGTEHSDDYSLKIFFVWQRIDPGYEPDGPHMTTSDTYIAYVFVPKNLI